MDDSSHSSLVWQEGACCSTKDPTARCLICSRDDVQSARKGPHLKHHPLLFKRYRRLANGHPGPFLMGVWYFCLMGTQSKLKGWGKDIPGGPFKLRSKTDNQVTNFKQVYCKETLQRGDKVLGEIREWKPLPHSPHSYPPHPSLWPCSYPQQYSKNIPVMVTFWVRHCYVSSGLSSP